MKAPAPLPMNSHALLGRLGHFSRRIVPLAGVLVLGIAAFVLVRAAGATRASLAFDASAHYQVAHRLQARVEALKSRLALVPAVDLLARYDRPKPAKPPEPQALPPPPPPPPTPAERLRGWRLRGTMRMGGQPVAVLNDELVSVGESRQGFTVVAISESHLDVRDEEGRLHRLDLYDYLPGGRKAAQPPQP